MTIHSLISRFLQLPDAKVGTANDKKPTWQSHVDTYVARYPYLSHHQDYLEFLRFYGGAGLHPESNLADNVGYNFLTIYGFGEFADAFSDEVDEFRYFAFACQEIRYRQPKAEENQFGEDGMMYCHYTMDLSGLRSVGIYAPNGQIADPYSLAWPTFTDWLRDLVTHGGHLSIESEIIRIHEAQVS